MGVTVDTMFELSEFAAPLICEAAALPVDSGHFLHSPTTANTCHSSNSEDDSTELKKINWNKIITENIELIRMGPKKDQKEEETTLSAVVIADNFNDSIFLHEAASEIPLACRPLCNAPIINYTLLWLLKTGVKRVFLVSTESRTEGLKLAEKNWSLQFEQFQWIRCAGSKSVGDSIRELFALELLKGDFLLISNPATITNSTLEKNIAKYYEMRKKDKSNALNLIYVEFGKENPKLALMRETNQLIAYHSPNNIHQLEGHVKESTTVSIRTDLMFSGIAICSENISNAFKDNFDFETLSDVIREFFDKEEILNLNIHIDVLPEDESAYSATDYATLMNLSQMVMDRWFYPIVPGNS
ncbi:hypothetical protein WR25_08557 [Diploscapter pachys]|uniref:Nucleotidyl transferase domain-containing protein n=1 Tax=Diploscapter pachys TaxID=2018661 RepID=A0A2A2JLI2_9BILA|nr:hypothetical protein WR25_08557 [Diploscapter pachys]